ncbi:NUDIX hydrolase [Treponema parvum]|nr:NUDIX domain-containing protein [Treponema parvum]
MMADTVDNDFLFCPKCGGKKVQYADDRKWNCPDCGFKLYNNVAAAVGLVIIDEKGGVIFEVRAKEPKKGFLALPGGFCDPGETAEEAAVRECKEELGVEPEKVSYLCSFPNVYDYKGIRYKTCDLFFVAKMGISKSGALVDSMHIQDTEVTKLVSKQVYSESDIDKLPLAFESAKKTLRFWLSSAKADKQE